MEFELSLTQLRNDYLKTNLGTYVPIAALIRRLWDIVE